jgi:hypothetical protein
MTVPSVAGRADTSPDGTFYATTRVAESAWEAIGEWLLSLKARLRP